MDLVLHKHAVKTFVCSPIDCVCVWYLTLMIAHWLARSYFLSLLCSLCLFPQM
uniref:Uncharacterized protein n=1 Tax=Rhizophora mucronata TaxID=61149 RepID=A0A2P2P690_RHIMU